jgi:hypothetical protein
VVDDEADVVVGTAEVAGAGVDAGLPPPQLATAAHTTPTATTPNR